jgi:hypothetical protein
MNGMLKPTNTEAPTEDNPHSAARLATVRKLGLLWGFLFLLGGILGFVPAITKDEMFLGFFMVNTPHNILHIISGILFLIASLAGTKAARNWFYIFGAFYFLLSLIGFWEGDKMIFHLISNNRIDSWGHGFLALVLLTIGFANHSKR